MTQELRKLADDLLFTGRYGNESEEQASKRRVARNKEASIAILELLDRLEKAEKDAKLWRNLCDLINDDQVSVTFYGRVNTLNTGLEVHDSGDLHDELDIAMEASK